MSDPADRPTPTTIDREWRVVVGMPVFGDGAKAGRPVGWQSLNKLPTGVRQKIEWDKAKKLWRAAAYIAINAAGVPQHLGRIEVDVELRFTTSQAARNFTNFEYSIKPVIDALGPLESYTRTIRVKGQLREQLVVNPGRHIVDGDDERYVIRGRTTIGEPLGRNSRHQGQIILTIRQLPTDSGDQA